MTQQLPQQPLPPTFTQQPLKDPVHCHIASGHHKVGTLTGEQVSGKTYRVQLVTIDQLGSRLREWECEKA